MIKLSSYQIYKELFNEVYPGDPPKEASEFKSINDFARELSSLKRVQVDKAKQDFVQELSSRTVGDNSFNALVEALEPQGLSRNSMETIGPLVEYLKQLISAIDDLKGSLSNEDRKSNLEVLSSSIKEGELDQEALENEKAYAKIEESPEAYQDLLKRSDRFNIEITDEVKKALESDDFISNFFRKVGSSSFLSAFNGISTDDIKEALEVVMKGQSSIDAAIIDRPVEDADVINLTSDSPEYVQQAYENRKERDEKDRDLSKFEKLETFLSGDQTQIENLMEQTSQVIKSRNSIINEGDSIISNYTEMSNIDWNHYTNEGSAYSESLVQQISNLREDLAQTSNVIREYYNTDSFKESVIEGQNKETKSTTELTSEVKKEDVRDSFKETYKKTSSEKKEEKSLLKEIKEKVSEKATKSVKDAGQKAIDAAKKQSKLMAIQTGRMIGSTVGLDLGPVVASLFTNPYVLAGLGILAAFMGLDMAANYKIDKDNKDLDTAYAGSTESEKSVINSTKNALAKDKETFAQPGDWVMAEGSYENIRQTGSQQNAQDYGYHTNLGMRLYQVKDKATGEIKWKYMRPHKPNSEYTDDDQRRDAQVFAKAVEDDPYKSGVERATSMRYRSMHDTVHAFDAGGRKVVEGLTKAAKVVTGKDISKYIETPIMGITQNASFLWNYFPDRMHNIDTSIASIKGDYNVEGRQIDKVSAATREAKSNEVIKELNDGKPTGNKILDQIKGNISWQRQQNMLFPKESSIVPPTITIIKKSSNTYSTNKKPTHL